MSLHLRLATAALLGLLPLTNAAYNLAREYKGQNFFSAWDYYGKYDNLTNGDVIWVNQSVAVGNPQLTYINSAGNAIIKVDDTTTVPYNEKRNSVRLTSLDKFNLGTVMVFDALHVPYGCSVWGALWTQGINWPLGGEIDIFEAVNLMTANQMALHTESGCAQADGVTQTGITQVKNCDNNGSNGAGCTVLDANTNSYGQPFAAAGGGVWVTEFATTGINIWFFSRANVPASLSTNTIDVSTFGTPSASYPASACDPAKYFSEQQIVIDITLCGDWSGVKSVLEATCPALNGTNTCYTTYVLDPKNYVNAYFELASVKIFASDPSAVVTAAGVTQSVSATGSPHPNGASSRMMGPTGTVAFGAFALTAMLGLVLQF